MIDHIDEHISEPLSLDGISWHVGLSKYYLNHMFSIYTGFSVMEYVRRKKNLSTHLMSLLRRGNELSISHWMSATHLRERSRELW
jgi:AraC-like DNA-binding protein